MEGIYWFRIGGVAALFLGSLWVLLPTVLRTNAEDRFAAAAVGVEAPAQQGAALEVRLPVVEGDPAVLARTLETRLRAAEVPIANVKSLADAVEVKLAAGGSKEDVARVAAAPGKASVHALDAVITLDAKGPVTAPAPGAVPEPAVKAIEAAFGADSAYWIAQAAKLAGVQITDTVALPIDILSAKETDTGVRIEWAEGQAFPPSIPMGAVAVDGVVAGFVLPDGAFYVVGDANDQRGMLISGELPGKVGPPLPEATPEKPATEGAATAESRVPAWVDRLLPNTAIALGLDLQGGIDLTLQVGLDEAILGQVARDTTYLKGAAQKEGLAVEAIRRSHTQPVVEVTTDSSLADVQEFMKKQAPDYVYVNTEERRVHRFELSETRQEQVRDQAVDQVLEVLRKRVDATGVKEPSIVKKSGGRINVQLPGVQDVQASVNAIGTTAVLEFRMVDEEFDDAYLEQMLKAAQEALPADQYLDDDLLNIWLWENKRLDEDRMILWRYDEPPNEERSRGEPYPLVSEVVLTGNDVNDAGVGWDANQQPYVTLEFKPRGGQIFCDITGKAVGKRFAVVLDNEVQSAPSIRERICGGAAQIEMGGAENPTQEAQTLALVLRTGALDAPVVVASVRHVGATLGADAVRGGTTAALVGSLLVYLFMAIWYKTSGVVADIALTANVLMVLACLGLFGATLTLPGIAGLALTVGMAVDANIVVYERIREELKLGVHPRKAVDIGFQNGLVAVLDGNVATMIAGIVLYSYGTGPIKGFAVTLIIGNITTLVTAVFVTRTLMDVLTRRATRLRI